MPDGTHLVAARRLPQLGIHVLAHPREVGVHKAAEKILGPLHDIGKVGIPDAVLRKPGRLTDEEFRQIQRHPTIGGDCLLAIKRRLGEDDFLATACEIALGHHERWDGGGYPLGRSGRDIPLAARIVALADVYDALTTPRVYKPAMPHEQARRIILEESGTHFDPAVVEAFRRQEDAFAEIAARRSTSNDALQGRVA